MIQINWNPSPAELRTFGFGMMIMCAVFAAVIWLLGWVGWPLYVLLFGGVYLVLGLTGTRAALPIYIVWMVVSYVMSVVISPIIICVFWYLIVTPLGVVMRLTGRDKLMLRKDGRESYWQPIAPVTDPRRYERQF